MPCPPLQRSQRFRLGTNPQAFVIPPALTQGGSAARNFSCTSAASVTNGEPYHMSATGQSRLSPGVAIGVGRGAACCAPTCHAVKFSDPQLKRRSEFGAGTRRAAPALSPTATDGQSPPPNPLLTDLPRQRQMNCEEPNFSCDDRCNAPIIRRKGSALLFLIAIPNWPYPVGNRFHAKKDLLLPKSEIS
jgi:hypothetical protein